MRGRWSQIWLLDCLPGDADWEACLDSEGLIWDLPEQDRRCLEGLVHKVLTGEPGRFLQLARVSTVVSREFKGPSTLATLFSHRWPRFCGGDIYSRRKPLFSSFGEHTAVSCSSVRQAVARPRHRQSVFLAAFCVRQQAH